MKVGDPICGMIVDTNSAFDAHEQMVTVLIIACACGGHRSTADAGSICRESKRTPAGTGHCEGAQTRNLSLAEVENFEAIPGHDVSATVSGRKILIGNLKLLNREHIALGSLEEKSRMLADDGKTPMFIALDREAAGIAAVADTVKEDSAEAIQALQSLGIEV